MPQIRPIARILRSKPTMEGAGVLLRRAFGFHEVRQFDPFLLLDDFHSVNPDDYLSGFPWHPHRGIETITYVLEGRVEHGDSMGNSGIIGPGDVQWMTAGSGIIHQEMPKGRADGLLWGFQLWANLPASHKLMDPRYREVTRTDIPEAALPAGVAVKVIAGQAGGVTGPVRDIVTDPQYLDFTVPASAHLRYDVSPDHTVLAYVVEGRGYFDLGRDAYAYEAEGANYFDLDRDCLVSPESLVLFGDGDHLAVTAAEQPVRFLLFSGKPLGEPIAWYGPIVMNTQEELRVAFEEYRTGTFIKHP